MKSLQNNETELIYENKSIIEEENLGYGYEFVQKHLTRISDPDVLSQIKKMSILEVIA